LNCGDNTIGRRVDRKERVIVGYISAFAVRRDGDPVEDKAISNRRHHGVGGGVEYLYRAMKLAIVGRHVSACAIRRDSQSGDLRDVSQIDGGHHRVGDRLDLRDADRSSRRTVSEGCSHDILL